MWAYRVGYSRIRLQVTQSRYGGLTVGVPARHTGCLQALRFGHCLWNSGSAVDGQGRRRYSHSFLPPSTYPPLCA